MSLDQQSPKSITPEQNDNNLPNELQEEIAKISHLMELHQFPIALSRIESAEAKFPNRSELMALRLRVLRMSDHTQESVELAKRFFDKNPNDTIAIAEYILSLASIGNTKLAINSLIDYCERNNDAIGSYLIRTIADFAYFLLVQGNVQSASGLANCLLAYDFVHERAKEIIQTLHAIAEVPLVIRELAFEYNCPDNFSGKKDFEHVGQLVAQLRWKEARKELQAMTNLQNQWYGILHNIAVLNLWLLDLEAANDTLKLYTAHPDLEPEDAADVEALRIAIHPTLAGEPATSLHIEYRISDHNAALEKLLSSNITRPIKVSPQQFTERGHVPPKGAFLILDKPAPPADTALNIDNVPIIIASCALFGKETDRDARIEVVGVPEDEAKFAEAILKRILGDLLITDLSRTQVLQATSRLTKNINPRFALSAQQNADIKSIFKLTEDYYLNNFVPKWINITFASLDNKTPEEAAKDPALRIKLLGLINLLQMSIAQDFGSPGTKMINELRKRLGYNLLEPISLEGKSNEEQLAILDTTPVWRWFQFDVTKLAAEPLKYATYFLNNMLGDIHAARKFAQEIINRPYGTFDNNIRSVAYDVLISRAQAEGEIEIALQLIDKAKNESIAAHSIDAYWYMHEIPIRLMSGQPSHAKDAIEHIIKNYKDNEQIMSQLYTLLNSLGILRQDGQVDPNQNAQQTPQNNNTKPAGLWTPDNQNNPPQSENSQKLWVPD
jgi:hypothetical protein